MAPNKSPTDQGLIRSESRVAQNDNPMLPGIALTFDDVLIVPGYSSVLPVQTDVSTRLTRRSRLSVPIMTAAMDTVTESSMAMVIAQLGGIGVIHKNLSIQEQCNEVKKVKRFEMGVVHHPITLSPEQTLAEVKQLRERWKISGFPVVQQDTQRLLGVLTQRDTRFISDLSVTVGSMMTSANLATVSPLASREEILDILRARRLERVLVVDAHYRCVGLVTARDLVNVTRHPGATKDSQGRLKVAAAIGTEPSALRRAEALVNADADVLVVDTAHGHAQRVLNTVRELRYLFSDLEIIGGNVATAAATEALISVGVDAVKVGIGPGSICTTRIVAGVGVPQLSAIMDCVRCARESRIPVIADGGVRTSGDLAKAIVGGADLVMMGSMLAGTNESPGEVFYVEGRPYKSYRGMGSLEAMARGSADRYFQEQLLQEGKAVAEGVSARVPYKGMVKDILTGIVGGLRAAMGYAGQGTIEEMQEHAKMIHITQSGVRENQPHSVEIKHP